MVNIIMDITEIQTVDTRGHNMEIKPLKIHSGLDIQNVRKLEANYKEVLETLTYTTLYRIYEEEVEHSQTPEEAILLFEKEISIIEKAYNKTWKEIKESL